MTTKAVDTTKLVVGQEVRVVRGSRPLYIGTVLRVTPEGVDIELDECTVYRMEFGYEVFSVNHDRRTLGRKILDELFGYEPEKVELLDQ
jgi:hypothetical protein